MKTKRLYRVLSVVLAVLLCISALPVLADEAAPLASWDAPTLARAAVVGGMEPEVAVQTEPVPAKVVGHKTSAGGMWARANHQTGAITGAMEAGDVVRFTIRVWYENGLPEGSDIGASVSLTAGGDFCGVWVQKAAYDAAETKFDEELKYPYKEFNFDDDVTLTADQVTKLAESGWTMLLGRWNGTFEGYPQTIYSLTVTNLTKNEVLYYADAEKIFNNGWSQADSTKGEVELTTTDDTIAGVVGQTAIQGGQWARVGGTGAITGTVEEGDEVYFTLRAWYENGMDPNGGLGGTIGIDATGDFCGYDVRPAAYDAAETKYDEHWSYPYKEFQTDSVTLTADQAAKLKTNGWSFLLGRWDGTFENYPQTIYSLTAVNATKKEVLYHAEGDALISSGWTQCGEDGIEAATASISIALDPAEKTEVIGQKASEGGLWARADHQSGAITGTIEAGDAIYFTIRAWYENGMDPNGGLGGAIGIEATGDFGGFDVRPAVYDAAELKYDETYGYPYKEFDSTDVTLTAEQVTALKEKGWSILLGRWDGTFEGYPQTLYSITATNRTKNEVLYHAEGESLVNNGWTQCSALETVASTIKDYEATKEVVISKAGEHRFASLSAQAEEAGIYALTLDADAPSGLNKLTAYQLKGRSPSALAGATSDGENRILFPVTEAMSLTFGITLAEGQSISLRGVTLERVGDLESIEKLWTAADMAAMADENGHGELGIYSEGNPGIGSTVIGYRADGGGTWSLADHRSGPIAESDIDDLDMLILTVKAYYENGVDPEGGLTVISQVPGAPEGYGELGYIEVSSDAYEEAPLLTDPVYGYSYKEFYSEAFPVFKGQAEYIRSNGFTLLIGHMRGTLEGYPQTIYEVSIVNDSKQITLLDSKGGALSGNGWSQCGDNLTWLTAKTYDPAYAEGVRLSADAGAQVLGQTTLSRTGSFCLELVMDNAESTGTVTACFEKGGLLIPVAQADYTATEGAASVSFPAVNTSLPLVFTVQTKTGETLLREAKLTFEEELTAQQSENAAAILAVNEKIAALPSGITVENLQDVADAKAAFDALSEQLKADVIGTAALEAAVQAAAEIQQDINAAQAVIDLIDALNETITADDTAAIAAAREAYDALTDTQKALVNNLDKLKTAEQTLTDIQAARTVIDKIAALPGTVTQENKAAVEEARAAYNALSDAQKALVTNYDKLKAAEDALAVTLGDVNDDGHINASDALLCLQHSVQLTTLTDNAAKAADVTRDGTIDASDALKILQYSVGLVKEF